jgi:hypothetical protein
MVSIVLQGVGGATAGKEADRGETPEKGRAVMVSTQPPSLFQVVYHNSLHYPVGRYRLPVGLYARLSLPLDPVLQTKVDRLEPTSSPTCVVHHVCLFVHQCSRNLPDSRAVGGMERVCLF